MSEAMAPRTEVRLAGEGGQGMILAGIILAEAAAIYDHKMAVQTQSYGPEARGGASKSEVVIADGEIDHPEVLNADVVVTLSQEAYDKYAAGLKPGGLLIVDDEKVHTITAPEAVRIPISRLAFETTGRAITANTVALGALVGLTGVVSRQAIEKAVTARAPRGTEEMNLKALEAGFEAAGRVQGDIALAEKVAALGAEDYLEKRARRASEAKYDKAMAKVAKIEPPENDRL